MLQVLEEVLRRRQSQGWLVGGTVRDRQLGRFSPDLDVAVADDPAAVAAELAGSLKSPWFALSTRHGAYRVLGPQGHVDVARMRGHGILEDLTQRDFTINAMAVPIGRGSHGDLLDPLGGLKHLQMRILAAVSDHIFSDDPLRLMRTVRLSHLLGFRIEPSLERLVRLQAGELERAAPERVVAELALVLDTEDYVAAVRLLEDLGLLRTFLPEASTDGSWGALEAIDGIITGRTWPARPWTSRLKERLSAPVGGTLSRPAALRLAVLLRLQTPDSAAAVGRRLKLSGALTSLLRAVCAWYAGCMAAGMTAEDCLAAAAASARSSTLFFWETVPWEPEVIVVATADAVSSGLCPAEVTVAALESDSVGAVLMERWTARTAALAAPPFDGRVIMQALGLTEGPLLGRVLRETRLAWEAGEIHRLEEALVVASAALAALAADRSLGE